MDRTGCLVILVPGVALALLASDWPWLGLLVGGAYFCLLMWGGIVSGMSDGTGRDYDPSDRF